MNLYDLPTDKIGTNTFYQSPAGTNSVVLHVTWGTNHPGAVTGGGFILALLT
ncbi:hypothetical protein [Leadbettera azotonutricia]|uniref:Uncharacterized protein n=1 Tax=Leadbettera azotonutricia (strain ATCC BAA-888 / DSM 13862 / ZAS-9) TaxID=545695 RepID=F5YFL2_LEAAZ|nr:hypothetical protein [Leadbettera azotonutricia]AEF81013.1 hypothetical protein TREAZ_0065 [Leadbettera azotonutricia ZAS-9]